MFFLDPSGNALEFKAFRDIETQLFAMAAPAENRWPSLVGSRPKPFRASAAGDALEAASQRYGLAGSAEPCRVSGIRIS